MGGGQSLLDLMDSDKDALALLTDNRKPLMSFKREQVMIHYF